MVDNFFLQTPNHLRYVAMLALTQLSNYLTLKGSFSAVSKQNFASKYSLESSRRDLQKFKCTPLHSYRSSIFCLKITKNVANCLSNFAKFHKISLEFIDFRADFYRNFTKSCRINKNDQIFAENYEHL